MKSHSHSESPTTTTGQPLLPYGVSAGALAPIRLSGGATTAVGQRISDIGLQNPSFDPTQPLRTVEAARAAVQTSGLELKRADKPKEPIKPAEISRRALIIGVGAAAAVVAVDKLTGGSISSQLPKLPGEFGGKNETAKTFEKMRELAAEVHGFSARYLSDLLPTYARLPDFNEDYDPAANPNYAIERQFTRDDGQEVVVNLGFREGKFSPESSLCLRLLAYSPKGERWDSMPRSEVNIEYILENHFAGRFTFRDFMKIMADPDLPESGIKIGSINSFTVDAKRLEAAWNIFKAGTDSLSVFHEKLGQNKQTNDIRNWKTPNVASFVEDAQQAFKYIEDCFEDVKKTART